MSRMTKLAALTGLVFVTMCSLAYAGEEETKVKSTSFLTILNNGGIVGHIIILSSVASLALAIEHAITIRRDVLVPPEILGQIEALFEEEEYEEAMTLCESAPNFLTNIIAAGLAKVGAGWDALQGALGEAADNEAIKMYQKISYLSLISQIAPMLGLYGTVIGMIMAFNVIAQSEAAPSPAKLAHGIEVALVTTAEGLTVAMPTVCIYFFFRNRVIRVVMEVGGITDELMERFRPTEA